MAYLGVPACIIGRNSPTSIKARNPSGVIGFSLGVSGPRKRVVPLEIETHAILSPVLVDKPGRPWGDTRPSVPALSTSPCCPYCLPT